jgi:hypothetical protein
MNPQDDPLPLKASSAKENWLTILKECPVSADDAPPRRKELARPPAN